MIITILLGLGLLLIFYCITMPFGFAFGLAIGSWLREYSESHTFYDILYNSWKIYTCNFEDIKI